MTDPIVPFDLTRLFLGDRPPLFMLEIAFRTLVIYGYTLLMIRWLGSRGIAEMSAIEFLLVVALGSAVGDPMFYPDVPLIHCMMVITVVVAFNKVLDIAQARNRHVENWVSGVTVKLAADGTIDTETLRAAHLTREEFFLALRQAGVVSLGEVRVAYLETSGDITVFKATEPRPGLPVEPPWDIERPQMLRRDEIEMNAIVACAECGTLEHGVPGEWCGLCRGEHWIPAR